MRRDELKRLAESTRLDENDEVWAGMRAGLCAFCQRPVSLRDGAIELALMVDGKLHHPSRWVHEPVGEPLAYLTHFGSECSPVDGYWLALDRLSVEEVEKRHGFIDHISRKRWGDHWQYAYGLRIAAVVAEGLEVRSCGKSPAGRVKPSPTLRAKVFERDGFRCRRCAHGPPDVRIVVDHILPVAEGGKTNLENLQTLCHPCNAGKSDRMPHEHDQVQ